MNYRDFDFSLWTQIHEMIAAANKSSEPKIAAFDADGTLWDTDMGENFFEYQIQQKQVPLPKDPWQHYFDLKKKNSDPREAYVWLAQINQGRKLEEVRQWAREALSVRPAIPWFSEQKKLIQLLQKNDFQVYVVTASIAWAVEPAAALLNIPKERVIGIRTKLVDGMITQDAIQPITYREGKAEALLQVTGGVKPWLCSGNSVGDVELLKLARSLALGVGAAKEDSRIYASEKYLKDHVSEKRLAGDSKWHYHYFGEQ